MIAALVLAALGVVFVAGGVLAWAAMTFLHSPFGSILDPKPWEARAWGLGLSGIGIALILWALSL